MSRISVGGEREEMQFPWRGSMRWNGPVCSEARMDVVRGKDWMTFRGWGTESFKLNQVFQFNMEANRNHVEFLS